MKMQYDFGLSKIYELVINSNPCYAFLLDGNSLIQNKLIVAHVLAHCDFFKNNARFSRTNRNMVESMSATAERIRAVRNGVRHGGGRAVHRRRARPFRSMSTRRLIKPYGSDRALLEQIRQAQHRRSRSERHIRPTRIYGLWTN